MRHREFEFQSIFNNLFSTEMMKILFIIGAGMFFLLSGCLGGTSEDEQFLVRVNDYKISNNDIDALLKFEAEVDSSLYASGDIKTNFIQDLIETQVLIQEAMKRDLDQKERFRQTIQRYWESTLIRDLLAEKIEQLRKRTTVSPQEIEEYYRNNKSLLRDRPLEELKPDLSKLLENRQVTAWLEEWIEELKTAADIEISDAVLAAQIKRKSN